MSADKIPDKARTTEDLDDGGAGPYILLGLLVAIGLIGGMLYFNGEPREQPQATITQEKK